MNGFLVLMAARVAVTSEEDLIDEVYNTALNVRLGGDKNSLFLACQMLLLKVHVGDNINQAMDFTEKFNAVEKMSKFSEQ